MSVATRRRSLGHGARRGGTVPRPQASGPLPRASAGSGAWALGRGAGHAPCRPTVEISRDGAKSEASSNWSRSGLKVGFRTWQRANLLVRRAREDPVVRGGDPPERLLAAEATEAAPAEERVDVAVGPRGRGGRKRPVGSVVPREARAARTPVGQHGPIVPQVAAPDAAAAAPEDTAAAAAVAPDAR
jgi:hypothetical protein